MAETECREQNKVYKNQGQHSSQNSAADDLHEKLRVVSLRNVVRCKSLRGTDNVADLDQA